MTDTINNNLYPWVQDEAVFTRAWCRHLKTVYPYNHIITRLDLKLKSSYLYFWTASEPNIRQAINVAGYLLNKTPDNNTGQYLSEPLECFIQLLLESKITRAWLTKKLPEVTFAPGSALVSFVDYTLKESVKPSAKKSSLYNFEGFYIIPTTDVTSRTSFDLDLGGDSLPHKLFEVSGITTNNHIYADYLSEVNHGLTYERLLACQEWLSSRPEGYIFASGTDIKIVSEGIAKKKPFLDTDKKVCATSASILKFLQDHRQPPVKVVASKTPAAHVKSKIPLAVREKVWRAYMSHNLDGQCVCCGREITFSNWHCAHIIAEANGGATTANNLAPACVQCNLGMKTQNLLDYRQTIIDRDGWLGSEPPRKLPTIK